MRAYELMVIADGDLEENNVETVVRWAQEQITARGGEVSLANRIGRAAASDFGRNSPKRTRTGVVTMVATAAPTLWLPYTSVK